MALLSVYLKTQKSKKGKKMQEIKNWDDVDVVLKNLASLEVKKLRLRVN